MIWYIIQYIMYIYISRINQYHTIILRSRILCQSTCSILKWIRQLIPTITCVTPKNYPTIHGQNELKNDQGCSCVTMPSLDLENKSTNHFVHSNAFDCGSQSPPSDLQPWWDLAAVQPLEISCQLGHHSSASAESWHRSHDHGWSIEILPTASAQSLEWMVEVFAAWHAVSTEWKNWAANHCNSRKNQHKLSFLFFQKSSSVSLEACCLNILPVAESV